MEQDITGRGTRVGGVREHLNVLEAVKQSGFTRQAASFYGIRVGRNGKNR